VLERRRASIEQARKPSGYCFAGSTALELARSGRPLPPPELPRRLASPRPQDRPTIKARASLPRAAIRCAAQQVAAFVAQMCRSPVDWQLHPTQESCTAHTPSRQRRNPRAGLQRSGRPATPGRPCSNCSGRLSRRPTVPTPPSLPQPRQAKPGPARASEAIGTRTRHVSAAQSRELERAPELVRAHARSGSARMHPSHAAQRAAGLENFAGRRSCRRHRPRRADLTSRRAMPCLRPARLPG